MVQADKSRVKDYINRLDNFDGPAVGEIAVGYEMFEEAFEIYKKFGLKSQAIRVLLDHQGDLDRAFEYAGKVLCQSQNLRLLCTTDSADSDTLHSIYCMFALPMWLQAMASYVVLLASVFESTQQRCHLPVVVCC